MFNLEQSILKWRRQMLAAGIKTPVPLEELEIHLREEIERQLKSGLSEQRAFEISVQQMGQPETMKKEFNKNERSVMKKIMMIGAGLIGAAVGMAFVMPAVAQYQREGAMSHGEVGLLALGIALTLAGIGAAAIGFKRRKA